MRLAACTVTRESPISSLTALARQGRGADTDVVEHTCSPLSRRTKLSVDDAFAARNQEVVYKTGEKGDWFPFRSRYNEGVCDFCMFRGVAPCSANAPCAMVPLKPNELRRQQLKIVLLSSTTWCRLIRAASSTGAQNDAAGADTMDDRCAFSLRGRRIVGRTEILPEGSGRPTRAAAR